jgi:hypothetical protein
MLRPDRRFTAFTRKLLTTHDSRPGVCLGLFL